MVDTRRMFHVLKIHAIKFSIMKRIRNGLTFDHSAEIGETGFGPSQTVPDMTLTVPELLERYTRGQELPGRTPIYNGDGDFPDISRFTIQEKMDYARDLERVIRARRDEAREQITVEQRIAILENKVKGKPDQPSPGSGEDEPPIVIEE